MDCVAGMGLFPDGYFDSVVCDPPYELTSGGATGFMGQAWDGSGIAHSVPMWREALRVLKPGGHLLAFSGSRTYHRMTCAIEDAGFEIRDQIMWVYGSGYPKSLDVSKAIDKAAGADRVGRPNPLASKQTASIDTTDYGDYNAVTHIYPDPVTDAAKQWQGWGTALKPAHEPICVARKPLISTVAANVLQHGTGAINIDACRVPGESTRQVQGEAEIGFHGGNFAPGLETGSDAGRWPANFIHDGLPDDWSRFFYCSKASKADRGAGNIHSTVKPTDLMRYLVRLVTQPGGTVLDPFTGSGSTGKAAALEGFGFIGFELSAEYAAIAQARIDHAVKTRHNPDHDKK